MSRIVLDTNVPVKASVLPSDCKEEELDMQQACMKYVRELTMNPEKKLVLDTGYEVMKEYENNVCKDTPMGKLFIRWLYDYYSKMLLQDMIKLEKDENGCYLKYPYDEETKGFDESDKKFIVLANAHPEKPPIVEAADGKWLGYVNAFQKYGIRIEFLDADYAKRKYEQKILNKRT